MLHQHLLLPLDGPSISLEPLICRGTSEQIPICHGLAFEKPYGDGESGKPAGVWSWLFQRFLDIPVKDFLNSLPWEAQHMSTHYLLPSWLPQPVTRVTPLTPQEQKMPVAQAKDAELKDKEGIHVFGSNYSNNVARVLLILEEKGLSYKKTCYRFNQNGKPQDAVFAPTSPWHDPGPIA